MAKTAKNSRHTRISRKDKLKGGFYEVSGPYSGGGSTLLMTRHPNAIPALVRPGMLTFETKNGMHGLIEKMDNDGVTMRAEDGSLHVLTWHELQIDFCAPDPTYLNPATPPAASLEQIGWAIRSKTENGWIETIETGHEMGGQQLQTLGITQTLAECGALAWAHGKEDGDDWEYVPVFVGAKPAQSIAAQRRSEYRGSPMESKKQSPLEAPDILTAMKETLARVTKEGTAMNHTLYTLLTLIRAFDGDAYFREAKYEDGATCTVVEDRASWDLIPSAMANTLEEIRDESRWLELGSDGIYRVTDKGLKAMRDWHGNKKH